MSELKRCSGCKSTILLETYFSKNRKGEWFKMCDNCREKTKEKQKKLREKNKDKFKCEDCDAKFSTKSKLQIHIKQVHLKIKDFHCEDCDAKFSTNGDLQIHIKRVHLKIKDFECKECDAKFSTNGHLKDHIKKVHLKIKDFECKECDAKFSTNSDLQRHIKQVHLKLKRFECKDCGYRCYANGRFQKHLTTCTGELNCSSGEFQIMKVLDEMEIQYQYNSSFEVKDTNLLKWDFIIENPKLMFIEYDGRQHFKPVNFGGISQERAEENFQKQKLHDKLKDDYCKENNYPLLRIPYISYGDIPNLITKFMTDNTDWGIEENKMIN